MRPAFTLKRSAEPAILLAFMRRWPSEIKLFFLFSPLKKKLGFEAGFLVDVRWILMDFGLDSGQDVCLKTTKTPAYPGPVSGIRGAKTASKKLFGC